MRGKRVIVARVAQLSSNAVHLDDDGVHDASWTVLPLFHSILHIPRSLPPAVTLLNISNVSPIQTPDVGPHRRLDVGVIRFCANLGDHQPSHPLFEHLERHRVASHPILHTLALMHMGLLQQAFHGELIPRLHMASG